MGEPQGSGPPEYVKHVFDTLHPSHLHSVTTHYHGLTPHCLPRYSVHLYTVAPPTWSGYILLAAYKPHNFAFRESAPVVRLVDCLGNFGQCANCLEVEISRNIPEISGVPKMSKSIFGVCSCGCCLELCLAAAWSCAWSFFFCWRPNKWLTSGAARINIDSCKHSPPACKHSPTQ